MSDNNNLMSLQSADRSHRVKTCLSSFERYCHENDRCLSQLSKLKEYFQTTITRYRRYPNTKNQEPAIKTAHRKSNNNERTRPSRLKGKGQNLVLSCVDPELIGVTKAKLYDVNKCERVKTEYTVPRSVVKSYFKMKKNSENTSHSHKQSANQSQLDKEQQRSHCLPRYDKGYKRYIPPAQADQIGDFLVEIKDKSSVINICHSVNRQTVNGQHTLSPPKKNKVVYSSKVNTAFNRYKFQETVVKSGSQTSKNKDLHSALSGWDVKDVDEELGASDSQHLQMARKQARK